MQSTIINIRFDLNGAKIVPINIALYSYLSTHSAFHFVLNAWKNKTDAETTCNIACTPQY